ncbi:DUF4192 domain-containing protein [Amycolatopsis taiwanensis]|uniref:DUF4192 domain-containing protein n=1 Tax=Amycolatopsis taiwanensis TaxID=342230 RepID=A0A9W6VGT5_9PSEU|nr:DUF4192 domain-containing protein [Amycolatopsis taiwanensis]GLY66324.1 hypothetical protein Atai01_29430 [Amycolatopsis taiwanensis]
MTTTTAPPDGGITIHVKDPAHLIAAVPHLLGFRPANSVVLVGSGGAAGKSVGPVLRLDLPASEREDEAAAALSALLTRHPIASATIVIVGRPPGHPPDRGDRPASRFVRALAAALRALGRPVEHAFWTPEIRAGAPWSCYDDPDCAGVLPDDAATPVAAALASRGFVTFDSREQMARLLDPDDPVAVARRERLLEHRLEALGDRAEQDSYAESFREVGQALARARTGPPELSDEQVVRLALALSDMRVRDACLAAALPAGSEQSMRAEALWLELVRKTPAPERAEAATLLGYSAYARGEGAFARIAFENALTAMPGHTLADLLARCLDVGLPPERVRNLAHVGDLVRLLASAIPGPRPAGPGEP